MGAKMLKFVCVCVLCMCVSTNACLACEIQEQKDCSSFSMDEVSGEGTNAAQL